MFRGSYSARIDDKGRLKIPNAFRALVEGEHGASGLYITSLSGDSVRMYPMSVWLAVEQRLARMPSSHPARLKFLDRVNYFGQVGEFDVQGRVLIPTRVRESAGMTGDVDVVGAMEYLEVWNHERLVAKMQRESFTDDDARALAEFGIEHTHDPVLVAEVIEHLRPERGGLFVDATVGLGGHALALLGARPGAGELEAGADRLIGIDRDEAALAEARQQLATVAERVDFVHADYREIGQELQSRGLTEVRGILADLGVSSMQFDDPARGFSFRQAGPLDMRADRSRGKTLAERLATVDEATLADVIFRFGEERHARRVARSVLRARDEGRLTDTGALASAVRRAAGGGTWTRIDPATRTFQALRIWVNDELAGLEQFLDGAIAVLAPGGRLAVIAFHSLEDRIVKHRFRERAAGGAVSLVTRRPVVPGEDEIRRNPRARSAKLRVVEKMA